MNPKQTRFFSYKSFINVLFYFFPLFFAMEVALRHSYFESIRFRLDDKKIHCLREEKEGTKDDSIPWMRLCPDRAVTLYHPEKDSLYYFRTDSRGERFSSESRLDDSSIPEVWIVGDSVAMGYLVSDRETVSWQLQSLLNEEDAKLSVRNLGVDAVGTYGIRKRLEEVLRISPPPKAAYWIYHISDLTDSFREENLLGSEKKRTIVRISYYLSKYSAIFNALKILYEHWKPETAENLVAPSQAGLLGTTHPHRQALQSLFSFVKEKKIPLVLVFLPEPTADYTPLVDSGLVKEVRQIALDSEIRVLDLQKPSYEFWDGGKQEIFLPKDGHPNRFLYRFISEELKKDLKRF